MAPCLLSYHRCYCLTTQVEAAEVEEAAERIDLFEPLATSGSVWHVVCDLLPSGVPTPTAHPVASFFVGLGAMNQGEVEEMLKAAVDVDLENDDANALEQICGSMEASLKTIYEKHPTVQVARMRLNRRQTFFNTLSEKDYPRCVKYLLTHHSEMTCRDAPWMLWADPYVFSNFYSNFWLIYGKL